MTSQETQHPQLSQNDTLIKKMSLIMFLIHFWVCSIPTKLILLTKGILFLLNTQEYRTAIHIFVIVAIGLAINFYYYKKMCKGYGHWLLTIWIAYIVFIVIALPYEAATLLNEFTDSYYDTYLCFLEHFHFNTSFLMAMSLVMLMVNFAFKISCLFVLWVNVRYQLKLKKIKLSATSHNQML